MDSDHVLHCDRHLAEVFLADLALERLFACVRSVVVLEVPQLLEGRFTVAN